MLNTYTTLGPLTLHTYTLLLAAGIIIGAALGLRRTFSAALMDVCLGALAGGLLLARGFHVVLNWAYFAYAPTEIIRWGSGGLDWHGAVWGALAGAALVARWRGVALRFDLFALALPVIALAGWLGCWAAGCGYGAEVDTLARYSPLLVAIAPDIYGIPAPRYRTHLFGVVAAGGLLLLALWLERQQVGRRFWLLLALLSLTLFGLGFLRADYALMLGGLRADQWLDLLMLGFSLGGMRHAS